MSNALEVVMYQTGQAFLIPTLAVIALLFVYAFFALGAFAVQWWQRRRVVISYDDVRGFPLMLSWYVVHRRHKRLPPVAQAFKEFLLGEGRQLIERYTRG